MRENELLELLDLKPLEIAPRGGLITFKTVSIGGLGDIRLKAIRFGKYIPVLSAGQFWLKPVYTSDVEEGCYRDVESSGIDILISLAELYDRINRPGLCEEAPSRLIADWCAGNIHPYAQQAIIDEIELPGILEESEDYLKEPAPDDPMEQLLSGIKPKGSSIQSENLFVTKVENTAAFSTDAFLDDLHQLIIAFHTYMAISDLKNGDPKAAKELYYAGKRFDGPALFEHFNASRKTPWADDAVMYGFADMFEPLRMEMAYDYNSDSMKLVPVVRSVFDACWYTLSCVTGLADQVDPGKGRHRFVRCKACGKVITAYGQQRYCRDPECQKQRNREKSRLSHARRGKGVLPNVLPNGKA